jgi:hypothetical protein
MGNFAQIVDGIVVHVLVINDEALENLDFPESEALGLKVLADSGFEGTWKQTSITASYRGKYACPGDKWTGQNFKAPEVTP